MSHRDLLHAAASLALAGGLAQPALGYLPGAGSVSTARPAASQTTDAPPRAEPAAAAEHVTSRDGTRIEYERSEAPSSAAGARPALVLVSGALSTRADLAALGALLAPDFAVIRYDRRGRGGSGDAAQHSVAREVEDLEALIDAAGGRASLFGTSSGAVLALEAAARLAPKVERVALFEPPFVVDASRPPVPEDFAARAAELVLAGRRGDAVELFMTSGVGVPAEMLASMRALPMWAELESLAHTLAYDGALMAGTQSGKPLPRERWAGAKAPTLVLDGGASPAWLHAAADALADVLPDARRRTLEGLDHGAASMAPQALAPVLAEFLTETSAK